MTVSEERFFRRMDWSAFWTACALSFVVYFYTLAPTVSLEDSGELAVAGDYLGVPHPPGYPIWTMLSWIFTKLFAFVQFRGQPNPAWSIGLLSAVFGSLAAGVTAMLICRSGSNLLQQSRDTLHKTSHKTEDLICWVGGVAGSLLFAFSPAMWSQSVIVEVYSLNAFFLVLVFLLTYRWMCRPTDGVLYATAFVFGLGLTNYQVLLLAMLPLVVAIMLRDTALFRDLVIVGTPYVIVLGLINKGYLPAISHPTSPECLVYVFLNFVVLLLAHFLLPRGKTVALTILMAEMGVAFYGFMPIVSDLRNPPMNWGYPRTWTGFKHAITRGQYEKISPTDVFSPIFLQQIGSYLTDLRRQFTLPVALLGFLPFTIWHVRAGKRTFNAIYLAIPLCILASSIVLAEELLLPTGQTFPLRLDKLLVGGVLLLLGVGGAGILVSRALGLYDKVRDGRSSLADRVTLLCVLLGMLALSLICMKTLLGKMGDVLAPLMQKGAAPIPPEAVTPILTQAFGVLLLILLPPAILAAVIWLMRGRPQLRLAIDDNSQNWVVATLSGFLTMSIVLIALANPKGDVQDNFIQRVKFISSHALYAIWVGYGLIFGLAFADTLLKRRALFRWLSLGAALALPLWPLHENAHNRLLITLYGGAEQNGHDFGWQFGNYQLRGADAISEELSVDEEPLPNPAFPPDMGQDAIFFGGTDPGRFVPTYMIYSARVREDVYLITQNALADNTYMNVMRDLYGDQIWIPAQEDSAMAFQRYVQEVRSGKRKPNAELKIDNGRVQVSGALGVMEINGILAEMIFEHNNYRHDFFVEESYVIQWMYPYLEPHGLIMKISADKSSLTSDMTRNDEDFWDWYTRRLFGDPKFRRDVVARKSFSKLRSAIAGLYSNRGRLAEAENAFQQARILYSLSPEANFRLVQEVYMRQRRFEDARNIMIQFGKEDPANMRVPEFINHLDRYKDLDAKIRDLESRRRTTGMDINKAMELADLYLQAQQSSSFLSVMEGVLNTTNLPAQYYYQAALLLRRGQYFAEMERALDTCRKALDPNTPPDIYLMMAKLYAEAQKPQLMAEVLEKYLEAKPGDWKAWLDLCFVRMGVGQIESATSALEQAVRIGGEEALAIVQGDERFAPIRGRVLGQTRNLMGIPGLPGMPSRPGP